MRTTLGKVTTEIRDRLGEEQEGIRVFGVDREEGLTSSPKYQSSDLSRYKRISPGDFAYNPMRLNIGSIGICTPSHGDGVVSPDYVVFRCDKTSFNPMYFHYHLKTIQWSNWVTGQGEGSVRERIYFRKLAEYEFDLPSLSYQDRLVDILSILDDKIALNCRMNETLEAMAQAIFTDWFVDFGPTRAKAEGRAPYLAPELWEMFPDALDDEGKPVGWMLKTLDSLFDVKIGRTPPRKEKHHFVSHGRGITWLSIKTMGSVQAFATDSEEDLTLEAVERFRVPLIDAGTVMVSFKLTVGRVAIAAEEMCSNEAIAQLRPRIDTPVSCQLTYCFMSTFDYDSLGSTSSIATAVNSKSIRAIEMIVPDPATHTAFETMAQPIFEQILRNIRESKSLATIRDLLLPKLMSGEIRLRDAAVLAEAVA